MRKNSLIATTILSLFLLGSTSFAQKYQALDEQIVFALDQNFPEWKSDDPKPFKVAHYSSYYPAIQAEWSNKPRKLRAMITSFESNKLAMESYKMFFARSIMPKITDVPELSDTAYLVERGNAIELDFVKDDVRIRLEYTFPVDKKYRSTPTYVIPTPVKEIKYMKKLGRMFADTVNGKRTVTPCYNDFYRAVYPSELLEKYKLFGSVYRSDIEAIKNYADNQDVLNARDNKGRSALHMAIHHNCFKTVKLLVDAGIDLNAKDENGYTPLMYSALFGDLESLKLLIANDADLSLKDKYDRDILSFIFSKPNFGFKVWRISKNDWGRFQKTPEDRFPLIEELRKAGIDVTKQDAYSGNTILMNYLLRSFNISDKRLDTLLDYGIDINAANKEKQTALLIATKKLNEDQLLLTVKNFVENGADVNVADRNNYTPLANLKKKLHKTANTRKPEAKLQAIREAIRVLIEAGAKE